MEQLPEAGQTPEAPPSSSHSQHLTAKFTCCQAEGPLAEPRASGRALRQRSVWPLCLPQPLMLASVARASAELSPHQPPYFPRGDQSTSTVPLRRESPTPALPPHQ